MPAPQRIVDLVEKFSQNFDYYQSAQYKEEDLRHDFLNPFFKELGWDIDDEQNLGARKEVRYEEQTKAGAPDYGFYLDGKLKFFVEAKNPSINVCNNQVTALQLRNYGWSAKTARGILSDFEEFSIYDTTARPKASDGPRTGRLDCIKYTEFVDRWDEIASLFSKEAVLNGSLEKLVKKKAKEAVDKELLVDISRWREALAKNIANRNEVSEERLNRIVQDSIARILFLRICEDRAIAHEGELNAVIEGVGAYTKLYKLFKKGQQRYDSDLFEVDSIANLLVDDRVLKDVISELYFPKSPYKFDAIPAEILGQVYEQFLGKVIRLTEGGHAKVEEKPEVRKAGGIYYTPTYIVEYIVSNTVGKLVEGKTPKQIEKLTILDPACGSGSFLLGAYKFLANWYRDWYVADDAAKYEKAKKIYRNKDGVWELTLEERRRVLIAHIYGVDLDRQAVEMAKLSLMLEALRSPEQQSLFNDRMLPRLGDNIKCGNSLIASDFSETPEDLLRVHAFDWSVQFETIMKTGGFDVVIGNPPYIRIQTLQETDPAAVSYLNSKYITAAKGNYDIYVVFVERALNLLNKNGLHCYILPHKFFNAQYGEALRTFLANGRHVSKIIHFGHQQVFEGASTYTCLLFTQKTPIDNIYFARVDDLDKWVETKHEALIKISSEKLMGGEWIFTAGPAGDLLDKLRRQPATLESVTDRIFQGLKTSADKIYIVEERERKGKLVLVWSHEKSAEYWLEASLLHPLIKGGDSRRFIATKTNRVILFPYQTNSEGHAELLSQVDLQAEFPRTWDYLWDNKAFLENRERGRFRGTNWYQFGRTQALDVISSPKLFTPDLAARVSFSYDETGELFFTGGVAGGYGLVPKSSINPKLLLGLLNSRLLNWVIGQTGTQMRGGYFSFEARFIRSLPVPDVYTERLDGELHSRLVELVDKMLLLMPKLRDVATESEKATFQNVIAATDRQIDQIVYALYGLNQEEIAIVEKSAG